MKKAAAVAAKIHENIEELGVERLVQKKPRAKNIEIVTAFAAAWPDRSFVQ
jgi:hypothetical protein